MTAGQKLFCVISTGLFFGSSLWLWMQMGEAVFITKALAFVQSCL